MLILLALTTVASAQTLSVKDLARLDVGSITSFTVDTELDAEDEGQARFTTRHEARTDELLVSTVLVCELEDGDGACWIEQRTWSLAGEPLERLATTLGLWFDPDGSRVIYTASAGAGVLDWPSTAAVASAAREAALFGSDCGAGEIGDLWYVEDRSLSIVAPFVPGGSVVSALK